MGIVAGRRPKAPIFRLTTEYEVDGFLAGQSIWTPEEVEGSEAPVEAVKAEVFGKVVLELIFAGIEGLNVFYVGSDRELNFGGKGRGTAGAGDERHRDCDGLESRCRIKLSWELE